MNRSTVLALCSPVVLSAVLSSHAFAGWSDMLNSTARSATAASETADEALNSVNEGVKTLQSGQQTLEAVQTAPTEGLTGLLMQRLNVSQVQAEGGAGALFQIAKTRMKEESFNQLGQAVPGMQNLLNAAPALTQAPSGLGGLASGVSAMTGVPGNTLSGLGSLVGSFQQLGMSGDMVQRFVPVLVDYVRSSSGDPLANALMLALTGS